MPWWIRKRERERAEAERALRQARQQSARAKARGEKDRRLFASISRIREENHIAEAVSKLMEGR